MDGSKDVWMISLVAFNITVMVYGFYRVFTRHTIWTGWAAVGAMGMALLLGAVVAGITYLVVSRANR